MVGAFGTVRDGLKTGSRLVRDRFETGSRRVRGETIKTILAASLVVVAAAGEPSAAAHDPCRRNDVDERGRKIAKNTSDRLGFLAFAEKLAKYDAITLVSFL